ncbi:hypothetical protein OPAG_01199 [Rhodococcus opacus PD630]|nr:hypothetical protein OPAG_01199 [Rhodococcus opacus PD630]
MYRTPRTCSPHFPAGPARVINPGLHELHASAGDERDAPIGINFRSPRMRMA